MILVCMHPICFDILLYLAHFLSVYQSKYIKMEAYWFTLSYNVLLGTLCCCC